MLKTAVLLNGPPGVGKDTIADSFIPCGFQKHQFKEQLYIDTAAFFLVPLELFMAQAMDRVNKEKPWSRLVLDISATDSVCISPRDALIHVSENLIKPQHGKNYFGLAAVERCVNQEAKFAVFSDSGFPEEMEPLTHHYDHVIVARLHRDGFDFDGDSRRYLVGHPNTVDIQLLEKQPSLATNAILRYIASIDPSALPLDN